MSVTIEAAQPPRHFLRRWGPEGFDAVFYLGSAVFALLTAVFAGLAGYRVWGWLALGPYLAAALASVALARRRSSDRPATVRPATVRPASGLLAASRRVPWRSARAWIFVLVLLGATAAPLAVEASLRDTNNPASSHVQPEVAVISQAATRLTHGQDLYPTTVVHRQARPAAHGEPAFESYFPYLPLMAVFGLPGPSHQPVRVTDTRIVFSVVTLLVVGAALLLLQAPRDRKVRALQVLTVLPTAALPLATGGDDLPVVAFLLLAMVLAQRRRPGWSGLVLGVVSAMKFTAWPLAALALFCARDRGGRRAPGRMLLGMVAVAGPVVAPFVLSDARAFFDNVILFPLGLSGVTSPAASNLPGHVLVLQLPWLHTALPLAVALVGGLLLLRRLVRRSPASPAEVASVAGWVMLVAITFAPATRVGYLLYPVNFFVWAWVLRGADREEGAAGTPFVSHRHRASSPVAAEPALLDLDLAPA